MADSVLILQDLHDRPSPSLAIGSFGFVQSHRKSVVLIQVSQAPARPLAGCAASTMSETFDFILFGGSGDLAMRKLLPALYYRRRDTNDASGWRVVGVGRHRLSREEYLNLALEHCRRHIAPKDFSEAAWSAFARQLDYVALDANHQQDYRLLADWLGDAGSRVRVFYLATEPGLFARICTGLRAAGP